MTNTLRGEAELVLGGIRRLVRPTFDALVKAEGELGPLFALIERAAENQLSLNDAAALLWHCLDGEKPGRAAFGEALLELGLAAAMPVVRAVLAQALQGR